MGGSSRDLQVAQAVDDLVDAVEAIRLVALPGLVLRGVRDVAAAQRAGRGASGEELGLARHVGEEWAGPRGFRDLWNETSSRIEGPHYCSASGLA